MDEVRLIDGNAIENELREFAAQIFVGCHRTTTDSEEAVHTCVDMVNEAQPLTRKVCRRTGVRRQRTRQQGRTATK